MGDGSQIMPSDMPYSIESEHEGDTFYKDNELLQLLYKLQIDRNRIMGKIKDTQKGQATRRSNGDKSKDVMKSDLEAKGK